MRYAAQMKADPTTSIVADRHEEKERRFLGERTAMASDLTLTQKIMPVLFGATFAVMICSVARNGWWTAEMTTLFLGAVLVIGTVIWIDEKPFVEAFLNGARDLSGLALIIGLARRIMGIMDAGRMTDTILNAFEQVIADQFAVLFIKGLYWIEVAKSSLVPSTSGLAVLSMPILAPVSDFAGVGWSLWP